MLTDWSRSYPSSAFGRVEAPSATVPAGAAAAAKIAAIPDDLPQVGSLDDVPALRGEQCTSLRHLIVKGYRPDYRPAYRSRSEALLAAVRGMLLAGCEPGVICAILLDPRHAISESVLEKGRKARAYAERQVAQAVAKSRAPAGQAERRPSEDEAARALAELNARHFVAQEGGQWRIYTEERDPERGRDVLLRSTQEDFKLEHANRHVLVESPDGKVEARPWGAWWVAHPRRRQHRRIAFLPGAKADEQTYNLWRGFAVEPRAGDWSLLRAHIDEICCSGCEPWSRYLVGWMARRCQRLDEQGWSAVVFRGEEGVGKGIVAQAFGSLFGQHFLHVSHARHLVGNFNLHLRDCLVLFADEAFWAGDKQGESTLKALITERDVPIEGKGRDVVMARNRVALMMASNHDWVVPAGPSARRYFALDVKPDKKDDRRYFDAILAQMAAGGREAMLHDLLAMDLKGFEVRDAPRTDALGRQKIHSLSGETGWWLDKLMNERLLAGDEGWRTTVPTADLHRDYVANAGRAGWPRRSTETRLGLFLKDICPPGSMRWVRQMMDVEVYSHPHAPGEMARRQVSCYELPDLAAAREHYRRTTGQEIGWPEQRGEGAALDAEGCSDY